MRSFKVHFNPSTGEEKSYCVYDLPPGCPAFRQAVAGQDPPFCLWANGNDSMSLTGHDSPEDTPRRDAAGTCATLSPPAPRPLTLASFMHGLICQLGQAGKDRTSETYRTSLNSFMRFRQGADLPLDEIQGNLMRRYEAYLHHRGITRNSSSFYMRTLRAAYNQAVEEGLTTDRQPFRQVYTGVDKTAKRAVPMETIRQIKTLDLAAAPALDFARDLFLFSFYTRGMSFIDMAYLEKNNLQDGVLSYRRRKTGQKLYIRWEECMQEIILKYETRCHEPYLLPILTTAHDNRRQYKNALYTTNKNLKILARRLGIPVPLTSYVARHSWASAARGKNIPIAIISESMGHHSEATTQIYLASLNPTLIDEANAKIIGEL